MSYSPNIPQANDDPRQSQAEILANFGKLNTDFQINHRPFTASPSGNRGFHTQIQFPTGLGADPNLADPFSSLYPKLVTGIAELFFQNDSTAADVFQLTNLPVTTVGTNYSIMTPWNIQINFGEGTGGTIIYSVPLNITDTVLTAQLTNINGTNAAITNPIAAAGTQLTYTTTGLTSVYYMVMALKV